MDMADQERPVVLVIEDQAMVREFVRDAVTGFGYDVRMAVPVIVLTGHSLACEMLQEGAFAYITKPFQVELLRRVLAAAVAGPA
jgi:CheY-like chemotaxis protein